MAKIKEMTELYDLVPSFLLSFQPPCGEFGNTTTASLLFSFISYNTNFGSFTGNQIM